MPYNQQQEEKHMTDNTRARAPRSTRTIIRLLGAMAVLLASGVGLTQQLASLMPPGSLLAVEVRQEGLLGEATLAELSELDWEAGLAVLEQAFESVGGAETVSGLLQIFGAPAGLDDTFAFCPALAPYFEYEEGKPVFGHYMMSVG